MNESDVCTFFDPCHIHSPRMPSARRSAEAARPVSGTPSLNAALLKTLAELWLAVFVFDAEPVPVLVVVVAGEMPVEVVPGAVVPVGETVGAVAGTVEFEVEDDDVVVETVAPMENVGV